MFIHEAVKNRTRAKPYITRKSWNNLYPTESISGAAIVVLPTDSPDCCVIIGVGQKPCRGWEPTAEDLTADDWQVVGF